MPCNGLKLIDFLRLNEKPILADAGKVTAEVGKQLAIREFEKFNDKIKEETKNLQSVLKKANIAEAVEVTEEPKEKPTTGLPELDEAIGVGMRKGKFK